MRTVLSFPATVLGTCTAQAFTMTDAQRQGTPISDNESGQTDFARMPHSSKAFYSACAY
jgi:hypothetical protein